MEPGQRVRHVKRGSIYEVVGVAEAQVLRFGKSDFPATGRLIGDGDHLVVYRGDDGKLWCRFEDEFSDGRFEAVEAVEAACAPQDDVATALRELLDAYSFYFPPGNPWGDKARKALGIETPSAPEGHDPTNPFAPRERPQKSVRLMTDAERRAAGLDPNGGFDGPTGAD